MCLQVEWGEKPRESVTVMPVSQDKSGLPRAALRPATTGTEMLRSFPDPGQGFVSVWSCWLRGFLFLYACNPCTGGMIVSSLPLFLTAVPIRPSSRRASVPLLPDARHSKTIYAPEVFFLCAASLP